MMQVLYDPDKTFDDNFDEGPAVDVEAKVKPNNLSYSFLGKKLYSNFGIPAGSLPNTKFVKTAFDLGYDIVHYKTQRSVPFPVNEFPNVIQIEVDGQVTLEKAQAGLIMAEGWEGDSTKYTITNSFGNPSKGPEFWQDDMKQAAAHASEGQMMIASVVGTIQEGFTPADYHQDFANTAALAEEAGAHAIELNLSCPNVANEGVICYTKDAVVDICQRVRKAIPHTPLLIKLGYFSDQQQALLEEILEQINGLVDGIAAINTIPAAVRKKDGSQALPGEGRLKSGLCGYGIKWAGLDWTWLAG